MKPMLACKTEGTGLAYPVLASPKLDGVRALIIDGTVLSRTFKPIPNAYVQSTFGRAEYNGLDGELIVGSATAPDCIRATTSGVMSSDGAPDVRFHVFDDFTSPADAFFDRWHGSRIRAEGCQGLVSVPHVELTSDSELRAYEERCLLDGYEGVMLRSPQGPYKHGRSTAREGWLLKLKRFEDSEAVVLGVVEQMRNGNAAMLDNLGHTSRSSHKAGLLGKGTLGALQVRDIKTGVEFEIGTGFDAATRASLWSRASALPGSIVKYKFFPTGSKERPRFPVFLAFRDPMDM